MSVAKNAQELNNCVQMQPLNHALRKLSALTENVEQCNVDLGLLPCVAYFVLLFLGKPAALLISISPSANQLEALTNCTTLMTCLPNITGKLTPAMTQGQNESILFARANSNAPALCGLANRKDAEGLEGFPGWRDAPDAPVPLFVT